MVPNCTEYEAPGTGFIICEGEGLYFLPTYFFSNKCLKYKVLMDHNAVRWNAPEDLQRKICYSRLELILDCVVSASHHLGITRDTQYLLALVTCCKTGGGDASCCTITYTETETSASVVDLSCIGGVVG